MVLALDPRYPRVWRTPDTLQFGVDAPVLLLHPVTLAEERMIAALADGVSVSGLRMIARRSRVDPGAVGALLDRLSPVLDRPDEQPAPPPVVVDGDGPTAGRIIALLRGSGLEVGSGLAWTDPLVEAAGLAVIVGSFAIAPARHARWLRRDVPHLPVVFGDRGVVVGPLVRPGRGPCVRCVDLHRTDADPMWPALAAQLHGRARPGETEVVRDAVAAVVAAMAAGALTRTAPEQGDGGTTTTAGTAGAASSRFDPVTGRWTAHEHMPHPECGCLGLPVSSPASWPPASLDAQAVRARRGSGTAGAPPGDPDATRAVPS